MKSFRITEDEAGFDSSHEVVWFYGGKFDGAALGVLSLAGMPQEIRIDEAVYRVIPEGGEHGQTIAVFQEERGGSGSDS